MPIIGILCRRVFRNQPRRDERFWSHSLRRPVRTAWDGIAFKLVYPDHVERIKTKLRSAPTCRFTPEPGAEKPQELGLKPFGHRIKKKPLCSVVIEVPETGAAYRVTP